MLKMSRSLGHTVCKVQLFLFNINPLNLYPKTGILQDKVSHQELIRFFDKYLHHKLTLACFKENSNEIIALNVLSVWNGGHKFTKHNGVALMNALKVVAFIVSQFNISEKYGVDKYLEGWGLGVNSKYREIGDIISIEMLKARVPLMKSLGLTVSSSLFSGRENQVAASKAEYTVDNEFSFEELAEKGYPCPGATNMSVKQMSIKL